MDELIRQLDAWMREHRSEFFAALNPPATDAQLQELELTSGVALPTALKDLLRWRNGQPAQRMDSFHPLTNEMFVSSKEMVERMRDMNELLQYGDISVWSRTWAPFMDNGNDVSCVDLTTGAVIRRDHETEEIEQLYASVEDWLRALVQELSTNNFDAWDFGE